MTAYPNAPGWKKQGTSSAAAKAVHQPLALGARILDCLRAHGPHTADETAFLIGKSVLSVRPRFSELAAQGKIVTTGQTRQNESGRMADVWKAVQ